MATWNTFEPGLDSFLQFALEITGNGDVTPGCPVTRGPVAFWAELLYTNINVLSLFTNIGVFSQAVEDAQALLKQQRSESVLYRQVF